MKTTSITHIKGIPHAYFAKITVNPFLTNDKKYLDRAKKDLQRRDRRYSPKDIVFYNEKLSRLQSVKIQYMRKIGRYSLPGLTPLQEQKVLHRLQHAKQLTSISGPTSISLTHLRAFIKHSKLKELAILDGNLNNNLCKTIDKNTHLQHIKFAYCGLNDEKIKMLLPIRDRGIISIDLSGNEKLGPQSTLHIAKLVATNSASIKKLNLSNCKNLSNPTELDSEGIVAIIESLHDTDIQVLNLSDCYPGESRETAIIPTLANLLKKTTTLRSLSLTNLSVSDENAQELIIIFKAKPIFKVLALNIPGVHSATFLEIFAALRSHPLISLKLQHPTIPATVMNDVAPMLKYIKNLVEFQLYPGNYARLTNELIKTLLENLRYNKHLKHLSLNDQAISLEGIQHLADALLNDPKLELESLDLSGNKKIMDDSIPILEELLKNTPSLTNLNLKNCGIAKDKELRILKGLKYATLATIQALDNELYEESIATIKELLDKNRQHSLLKPN